jgi:tellurite methyltransferase
MSLAEQPPSGWSDYYKAVDGRAAREFYRQSVSRFEPAGNFQGVAIDLGPGTGVETLDLLRRGWQVLAIDQQAEAINWLHSRVPDEHRGRLQTRVATFLDADLPAADFIWAGLSLPFCFPDRFDTVWAKILSALKPGGRFAGDFFGVRHVWAQRAWMTFHTREHIDRLCQSLRVEYFIEEEGERATALEGIQHWHAYSLCAKKD